MFEIVNIRRGSWGRSDILYARVVDSVTKQLLVAATLDYCVEWVAKFTPPTEE